MALAGKDRNRCYDGNKEFPIASAVTVIGTEEPNLAACVCDLDSILGTVFVSLLLMHVSSLQESGY